MKTQIHEERVNAVLSDSDACCPCGADPRFVSGDLTGWFIDIQQTPDADVAEVRCPRCW
jgi:hypothetical protein